MKIVCYLLILLLITFLSVVYFRTNIKIKEREKKDFFVYGTRINYKKNITNNTKTYKIIKSNSNIFVPPIPSLSFKMNRSLIVNNENFFLTAKKAFHSLRESKVSSSKSKNKNFLGSFKTDEKVDRVWPKSSLVSTTIATKTKYSPDNIGKQCNKLEFYSFIHEVKNNFFSSCISKEKFNGLDFDLNFNNITKSNLTQKFKIEKKYIELYQNDSVCELTYVKTKDEPTTDLFTKLNTIVSKNVNLCNANTLYSNFNTVLSYFFKPSMNDNLDLEVKLKYFSSSNTMLLGKDIISMFLISNYKVKYMKKKNLTPYDNKLCNLKSTIYTFQKAYSVSDNFDNSIICQNQNIFLFNLMYNAIVNESNFNNSSRFLSDTICDDIKILQQATVVDLIFSNCFKSLNEKIFIFFYNVIKAYIKSNSQLFHTASRITKIFINDIIANKPLDFIKLLPIKFNFSHFDENYKSITNSFKNNFFISEKIKKIKNKPYLFENVLVVIENKEKYKIFPDWSLKRRINLIQDYSAYDTAYTTIEGKNFYFIKYS